MPDGHDKLATIPLVRLATYIMLCCPTKQGIHISNTEGNVRCSTGVVQNNDGRQFARFQFEGLARSLHMPLPSRANEKDAGTAIALYMTALSKWEVPYEVQVKESTATMIQNTLKKTTLAVFQNNAWKDSSNSMIAQMLIVPGNWLVYIEDKSMISWDGDAAIPLVFQSKLAASEWLENEWRNNKYDTKRNENGEELVSYEVTADGNAVEYTVFQITEQSLTTHRNNYLLMAENRLA